VPDLDELWIPLVDEPLAPDEGARRFRAFAREHLDRSV
jgi:hypothetical protein